LTGATMPAVLVEVGFLSNPREEILFRQAEYKEKIAAALHRSILEFRRDLDARTGRSPGAREGS
ncbi:MAG: N-acetylmuramoyl-L-alanine amidase, partial [Acidobacteria bacterium]|nr:N-acetylmuramoyl-L-alanine amidase [Acidobacteriota bacterium]